MASSTTVSSPDAVTSNLLSSGKYSDFTIKSHGQRFKFHRAVVCVQSKPLAAMVDGKFKVAVTGEVDLNDNESDIVGNKVKFLYTGTYDDGRDIPKPATPVAAVSTPLEAARLAASLPALSLMTYSASSGPLLTNAKVYVIGDKYDIQSLKDLAAKKYEEVIPDRWNSASFVGSLKLLAEETLDTYRALKGIAMKTAGRHAQILVNHTEFVTLCKENGEITFDVLKTSLAAPKLPQLPSACAD